MSDSETRKKTELIMVRVTPEEKAALTERAHDANLTTPAYLRDCGLGRTIRSKVEHHVINELRRLGGLQKHLFKEGGGAKSKEFAEILVEIQRAIARIGDKS
ncbi:plasmid mobilization protein MobA [Pseudomonas sp. G(2018)]|uniref:plasmid mobilization protein MobA n=1 Tax=Pseudomonas sp. G(2018) TaxID=2502242 RepID=UPI001485661C|nr:plasmid mobilization protein MobA [Pseudomonas sp. G(2018)]